MLLYNVTISIDPKVENEWVNWMKDVHIPDVMATGRFVDYKFLKLLGDQPDATGITYAVQYFSRSISDVEKYLETEAPKLQKEHMEKFQDQFVAFRTLLEEV
jgi:hypothetical protein